MKQEILEAFLYNKKLKFSEIEKEVRVRSNKLAYHVKNMIKEGILSKNGDCYTLLESSAYIVPYISEKVAALPVILIMIKEGRRIFLVNRNKRPFKNKLALPAGRLMIGESIKGGTTRILKEKYGIKGRLKSINSVSLEHVKNKERALHSFLLILVTATTKQTINLLNLEAHKKLILKSDYDLIRKDSNKKVPIREYNTKDL